MRCLACGIEMQLLDVVPDANAPVPGYAHYSFECPGCHDRETRLLFGRAPPKPAPPPAPEHVMAPSPVSRPVAPVAEDVGHRADKPIISNAWARAMNLLRRRHEHP
jgi:hypothetical protein